MEIEIKPMSLDERLLYIQQITENQQNNTKRFPWGIAICSLILGAGLTWAIIAYQNRKRSEQDEDP